MKKIKEMNVHERTAYWLVKETYGSNVGGWYNIILDGGYGAEECIPESLEKAKKCIYDDVMMEKGYVKHLRFAGKEFIEECIDRMFKKDEDIEEIANYMKW